MFHIREWENVENASPGNSVELAGIVVEQGGELDTREEVFVVQNPTRIGETPFEVWGVFDDPDFETEQHIMFSGEVRRVTEKKDVIVGVDMWEKKMWDRKTADFEVSERGLDEVENMIDSSYDS